MTGDVADEEIGAAIRSTGLASREDVLPVVLETDGSFSVIPVGERSGTSAIDAVRAATSHR